MELIIMGSLGVVGYMLMGAGDEDKDFKKTFRFKFLMDQYERLAGDMLLFAEFGDFSDQLSSISLVKTITDLTRVLEATYTQVTGDEEDKTYRSGKRKGENKLAASIVDFTPGAAGVKDFSRLFSDQPYQSGRSKKVITIVVEPFVGEDD